MNEPASAETRFAIRKATAKDSDGILKCLRLAFEPFKASYTPGAYADTVLDETMLYQRLREMTVFVATFELQVIGTIAGKMVDCEEGHLRGMAVYPGCQGDGVAQQLLDRAESELRTLHCKRITLDTTKPLSRAVRFYERNGFRPTGRVTDFFGMPLFEYEKRL
jgi:GNAT superfamily N-acetyltransferase